MLEILEQSKTIIEWGSISLPTQEVRLCWETDWSPFYYCLGLFWDF